MQKIKKLIHYSTESFGSKNWGDFTKEKVICGKLVKDFTKYKEFFGIWEGFINKAVDNSEGEFMCPVCKEHPDYILNVLAGIDRRKDQ